MMSPDNRHKFALPYWARPGLATFAAPADGGGKDDESDEDDDDDDESDDESDDPDEGKTPEELKAELTAARAALAKANGSSAKRRRDSKALKARIAELEAGGGTGGDDDAPDVEAVRKAATSAATQAANARIVRAEARGALKALGVKPERVGKIVALIDLDDVDVDDEGEVDGLDDAIEALKEDYPELFGAGAGRKRRSTTGDDDRDGSKGKGSKITDASKLQAAALLGRQS